MQSTEDRMARLRQAAGTLASDLSLDAVLQRLVELAVEITDARYGALGVLGLDGIEDFVTVGVTPEQRAAIGDLPRGRGILGVLISDPRPIRIDDLGRHPASVGFPPNHPPMRSFVGAPLQSRGTVFGNLYLTEKRGGGVFTAADEEALVLLAAQAGTALANARLYDESQRRGRWLDAVREIATSSLEEVSPHATLELTAARALSLVDGDTAVIAAPVDSGTLVVAAAAGAHADELAGMRIPLVASVSGEVMRSGRTAVFVDAMDAAAGAYIPMVTTAQMGPAVFVPLTARGGALGTLAVSRHRGRRRFGDDDVGMLESYAAQAALVLAYGRAQQERRRLELVEDRGRIAKDLHDGVIQSLFAVGMGLQGTATMIGDERIASRIQEAIAEIDRAISDLRNYIFGLRPGVVAGNLLSEALDQLAHEFQARTGITTATDIDASLDSALERHAVQLVQIVREALSNVAKHSGATTCRVSMLRDDGHAVIEVDDDGRGFDGAEASKGGMGLPNLYARAETMGAELQVSSAAGEGTTVRLRAPLDNR